jgi:hypothetical protein
VIVQYKGYELEAKREQCLGGWGMLYFTIYKDNFECVSSFEDSEEKVRDKIKQLKEMVDIQLKTGDMWDED